MKKPPTETTLLSQAEVARRLNITRSAVGQLLRKKIIQFKEIAGRRVISLHALEHFQKNRPLPGWGGYQKKQKKLREIKDLKNTEK